MRPWTAAAVLAMGLGMADLTDQDVTQTLDYLGRQQPIGQQRVGLGDLSGTGGPSAGGGGVTASPTPSVGARADAARALLNPGGPSGAQEVLTNVGRAKTFAEQIAKLNDLFPQETVRGQTGDVSLSDRVRDLTGSGTDAGAAALAQSLSGPVSGGSSFGTEEFLATASPELLAQFGEGAGSAAAGVGEATAETGVEVGGQVAGGALAAAGSVIPFLGSAFNVAQDIMSKRPDEEKALDAAVDVASAFFGPIGAAAAPIVKSDIHDNLGDIHDQNWVKFALYDTNPIALPIKIIDDILQAFGVDVFGGDSGPNHEQRENLEIQNKITPQTQGFQNQLTKSKTPSEVWGALTSYQSGYVGGTSPVAIAVQLPMAATDLAAAVQAGAVTLPTRYGGDAEKFLADHPGGQVEVGPGQPNAHYPVFTQQGFFDAVRANPKALRVGIQAGDAPHRLEKMNAALKNTILRAAVQPEESAPVEMPTMPTEGFDAGGAKNPVVNPPPGPSGALGFAQDVLSDPSAGP